MSHTRLPGVVPILLGWSVMSAADVRYHAQRIPCPPGRETVIDRKINDQGQIAGAAVIIYPSQRMTPCRREPDGNWVFMPMSPEFNSVTGVTGFNTLGHLTGDLPTRDNGDGGPFLWIPGVAVEPLANMPGTEGTEDALGVNDLDQVVGNVSVTDPKAPLGFRQEAFLWDRTTRSAILLGDLPGGNFVSAAHAVNNSGTVCGTSVTERGYEAFVWTFEGGIRRLDGIPPGVQPLDAFDINERGQVSGYAWLTTRYGPYVWDPDPEIGVQVSEPPSGRRYIDGLARAINNRGEAIGYWTPDHRTADFFIWDAQRGARYLDDLLDAASREYVGLRANDINNRGQIIAAKLGLGAMLLLTPIVLGEMNCDGVVDAFDVAPFVEALLDMDAYLAAHPDCWLGQFAADINQDGRFDNFDIDPFVELLAGP